MSETLETPSPDWHNQAMIDAITAELSAVPVAIQDANPPRTLTIPRDSLLHDWIEIYWAALERTEFLDWASTYDIDFDTFNIKGDTLEASTLRDGVHVTQVFTLEDASGWWKVAPIIQAIAQKIDPAGHGLPHVGGKSKNPLHAFPRRIVLAFYGYPEPENRLQAKVIAAELKDSGFAPIGDTGHTTSALVSERTSQQQDYLTIAQELELALETLELEETPFNATELGRKRVSLMSSSLLASTLEAGATALQALIETGEFLELANLSSPHITCDYSAQVQKFFFTLSDGSVVERAQRLFITGLPAEALTLLIQLAGKTDTIISSDKKLRLDQVMECYGLSVSAEASGVEALVSRLRKHTWSDLPYVSEFIQSRGPVRSFTLAFGQVEDYRHISRRLEALSNKWEDQDPISLAEFSKPDPRSPLGVNIDAGKQQLLDFRSRADFQRLLKSKGLAADSRLLLTTGGHVGAPGKNEKWAEPTEDVEADSALKAARDRLRPVAERVGGSLRTNGQVSLAEMLRAYRILQPVKAASARIIAQWLKPMQLLRPGFMDHWHLLGKPGELGKLTDAQRKIVIDTTTVFLAQVEVPLLDYLCEGVISESTPAILGIKADFLISQILISARAHELGNQLLLNLFPDNGNATESRALNRDRLVLTALLLSFDPRAGQRSDTVIDQKLNDSFFWGESYSDVRRYIDGQFALRFVKHKPLATHLLLSGIAPEFLIRDIPEALRYMSSYAWVKLKQVVLFIEEGMPGMSRLMTYAELVALSELPVVSAVQTFRTQEVPAKLPLDWAISRGLIEERSATGLVTAGSEEARMKKAASAFDAHCLQLFHDLNKGFYAQVETPYTVALADLRRVFKDNVFLESKMLRSNSDSVLRSADPSTDLQTPQNKFSLVELHMANELKPDMKGWESTVLHVKLSEMTSAFARLKPVSGEFAKALEARLKLMKSAFAALIKEHFSQLPIMQRLDLEWNRFELFALHPVPSGRISLSGEDILNGPFAMILSCSGSFPRIYEIFMRDGTVRLRRDIDHSILVPATNSDVPRQLPFDAEAYLKGAKPEALASCRGIVKQLHIEGTPLTEDAHQAIPATFTSARINAIAATAVKQLFDAFEPSAVRRAQGAIKIEDVANSHATWQEFFRSLTPPGV